MFVADQVSGAHRWPVVRVNPGSETCVTLLSSRFLPLTVHWVGRSVPCCGDHCSLCSVLPGRGLFYLAVMCMNKISILELASLSSVHLEQHCRLLHGGMVPGHIIRLSRRSKKAPISSEVIETMTGVKAVEERVLISRVMALYALPGPNPEETIDAYETRISNIARKRGELEYSKLKVSESERTFSR